MDQLTYMFPYEDVLTFVELGCVLQGVTVSA